MNNPKLINLYDELNRTLEDLAPTLENLAHQPGKGDSVAEYDIMELFHKATRALWITCTFENAGRLRYAPNPNRRAWTSSNAIGTSPWRNSSG